MVTSRFALTVVTAGAVALAWVAYFRWKDRARPEPLWLMLAAFGGGAVAVALAGFGFAELERASHQNLWNAMSDGDLRAIGAALLIGVGEEGAKLLPVIALALWSRNFDELLDGAVYAGCAGAGFAVVETVLYAWGGFNLSELWPRVLAAPISHALFLVPAGLGLAAWRVNRRAWLFPLGFALSVTAHGAYDLSLAAPGTPALFSAAIVAALWLAFIVAVPKLARMSPVQTN